MSVCGVHAPKESKYGERTFTSVCICWVEMVSLSAPLAGAEATSLALLRWLKKGGRPFI